MCVCVCRAQDSVVYQTAKMERFAQIVDGFQSLTIFTKRSILDVWKDSEYASGIYLVVIDICLM